MLQLVAASRQAFAFSRDGALPFSRYLYRMNKYTQTPVEGIPEGAEEAGIMGPPWRFTADTVGCVGGALGLPENEGRAEPEGTALGAPLGNPEGVPDGAPMKEGAAEPEGAPLGNPEGGPEGAPEGTPLGKPDGAPEGAAPLGKPDGAPLGAF